MKDNKPPKEAEKAATRRYSSVRDLPPLSENHLTRRSSPLAWAADPGDRATEGTAPRGSELKPSNFDSSMGPTRAVASPEELDKSLPEELDDITQHPDYGWLFTTSEPNASSSEVGSEQVRTEDLSPYSERPDRPDCEPKLAALYQKYCRIWRRFAPNEQPPDLDAFLQRARALRLTVPIYQDPLYSIVIIANRPKLVLDSND